MTTLSAGACALALLSFSHSIYADAPPIEPVRRPFLVGAALGLGNYKSASGIWSEAFVGYDFELTRSLELRTEVGPLLFNYSQDETLNNVPGRPNFENTDDVVGFGVLARGALGYSLSSWLGLRVGILAGYAHVAMDSTYCGSSTLDNPFYGFSIGAAARFGQERRFEIGVLMDAMTLPLLRCADSAPPSTHRRDELSFDDPSLIGSARFAFHW